MVWCLKSHPIGNVVNEVEVEIKDIHIQESAAGDAQNLRHRGRGEKIAREDRGAGAERDVPVEKEDRTERCADSEHCLIRSYLFCVLQGFLYIYI